MKHFIKKLPLSLFLITLCSGVFSEPPNLTLLKTEVKVYHDSGLYDKELAQIAKKAQNFIDSQVLLNQKRKVQQKLAIVLDIDETSLSNYKYMIQRDFTGTHVQFHQDVLAANAPAIKPILALYQDALNQGIKVFFVSGRSESERDATRKNLIKAGYTHWSGLYLRPNHYSDKSIIPFKSHARELITQKGYTIVATIGDQYSDLKGGYAERGFKLPNPFYHLS